MQVRFVGHRGVGGLVACSGVSDRADEESFEMSVRLEVIASQITITIMKK
jgi:hypothetical protein